MTKEKENNMGLEPRRVIEYECEHTKTTMHGVVVLQRFKYTGTLEEITEIKEFLGMKT